MKRSGTGRRGWRWWLREAHLWIGLALCLPLVVLGVTGSLLVYGHEIDDALTGRTAPQVTPGEPQPLDAIVAAAVASAGGERAPTMARMPDHAGDPAMVRLRAADGGFRGGSTVLVDPVSLAVLADAGGGASPWLRVMHDLHGHAMVPGGVGRDIIGWLGVAMLVLGLSGLVMWWPRPGRWKAAFTVKRGARGLRLHRDLHGAVGIWSLAVFVVVSLSGVYIAFPETTGAALRAVFGGRDLRAEASSLRTGAVAAGGVEAIASALALARAEVADAGVAAIAFGRRPEEPVRVTMRRGAVESRLVPQVEVYVDPAAATVLAVHDPGRYGFGETVVAWQRALHYGHGLGPVYKALVFLSGLLPLLFAITGVAMWWLKRRARRPARHEAGALAEAD